MSHLDLSFDAKLEVRPTLPWLPWVGRLYAASPVRTLVVGESVYDWSETAAERETFNARYARRDGLRRTHNNHAMNFNRDSPYVRNIERALYGSTRPAEALKASFWTSVAYHNLVLEPLKSASHRPGRRQLRHGWVEALALCELLAVQQVLVYGVGSADALKHVAKEQGFDLHMRTLRPVINKCLPRVATLDNGKDTLKLLFIRHPSAFFSWDLWTAVLREHLALEHLSTTAINEIVPA